MATELTIARALAKIKILQSKVERVKDTAGVFVNGYLDGKGNRVDIATLLKNSEAEFKSRVKTLENIDRIKSAIAKANVEHTIMFKDQELTLLEAINTKSSVHKIIEIVDGMLDDFRLAAHQFSKKEEKQNEDIKRIIEQSFANKNNQPKDVIETITANFKSANKLELISLFTEEELTNQIKSAKDDIKELDFLLSEANATIKIQVDLDI